MDKKISFLTIVIILLVTNAVGFILSYFELDSYIILLGFRFQLSLILPFAVIFRRSQLLFYKDILTNPAFKKNIFFIYLLIFPVIILPAILFIVNKIKIGDPDYFYEFGLSSIFDFPVYLIWNSIQLLSFFLFIIFSTSGFKKKFTAAFLIILFIFSYEFIPANAVINYFLLISLIFFAVIIGILLKYFQNVYWLITFTFSVLWLHILLFGSGSETLIHLLFASQYNLWEGFLSVSKPFEKFLLPVNLLLIIIFLFFKLRTGRKVN